MEDIGLSGVTGISLNLLNPSQVEVVGLPPVFSPNDGSSKVTFCFSSKPMSDSPTSGIGSVKIEDLLTPMLSLTSFKSASSCSKSPISIPSDDLGLSFFSFMSSSIPSPNFPPATLLVDEPPRSSSEDISMISSITIYVTLITSKSYE